MPQGDLHWSSREAGLWPRQAAGSNWSEPKRTRQSVRYRGEHIGYITVVEYPNRDITAFPEGLPYFEVVVSDLHENHVALFQRFKQHWLIHCGSRYDTTDVNGETNLAARGTRAPEREREQRHVVDQIETGTEPTAWR